MPRSVRGPAPPIATGASVQFATSAIESVLAEGAALPSTYALSIRSPFNGQFQHVLWRPANGTLTNLSTCDGNVMASAINLINVHSSNLDASYPSSVVVNNTGTVATTVTLAISNANTGAPLGTYTTPTIPAKGQVSLPVADIERSAGIAPTSAVNQYVIVATSPFSGFLQHLVNNVQTGVITDMTTTCAIGTPGLPGALSTFSLPTVTNFAIAAGPDGNMWATSSSGNSILRITPTGAVTSFALPVANAAPSGIVAGSDGNMWFIESATDKIGKITPAGVITLFDTGVPSTEIISDIAKGPDGNIWWSQSTTGTNYGRITPQGVVTNSIRQPGQFVQGLALGGDNAMWSRNGGTRTTRITADGDITDFALPATVFGNAVFLLTFRTIASHADGSVWFLQPGLTYPPSVGRMTTGLSPLYRFFSLGRALLPSRITAGPDDAMWAMEHNGPRVSRVTPFGRTSTYRWGTSALVDIAPGPDQTLWALAAGNPGRAVRFAIPRPGVRLGAIYSTAQQTSQSFLRFYNNGSAITAANVELRDGQTAQLLGTWTSPAIEFGGSVQYSIGQLETALPPGTVKPDNYTISVRSDFAGYVQHVLWRPSNGTLTNLSTCDAGVTALPFELINVHSSNLDAGYPSSVVVHNTGVAPTTVTLGVYAAATGIRLGLYATPPIAATGQLSIPVATIERAAGIVPPPTLNQYVIKAETAFAGFLQHLVENKQAGVTTDMSTVYQVGHSS